MIFIKRLIRTVFFLLIYSLTTLLNAQVGIGTITPNNSAALEVYANDKGFLPPRLSKAQRDLINAPAIGLTIYNLTDKCLNFYTNTGWFSPCQPSIGSTSLILSSLDGPSSIIINPNSITLDNQTSLFSLSAYQISIPYTVTTGGDYPPISLSSTGVTGLFADASSGTITNDGNFILNITGIPSSGGIATFTLEIGGLTTNIDLPIATAPSIATIRCSSNKPKFFGNNLEDGTAVLNDGNTYIRVKYTGGNQITFDSESILSTGVTGLTATVATGTLANGNGEVNFVISGTPSTSGTATFPISFLGVSNSSCQGGELDVTVSPPGLILSSLDATSMNILNPNGINLIPSNTLAGSDNYQVSIPYIVATPGVHPAISITSTGITGLNADFSAGTITSDGNLILDITGTPSGDGNANFSVSLGGQTANFDIVIATPPSIATIRCSTNKPKFFGTNLIDGTTVLNDGNTYIRVKYTGGNEKTFTSESISSTGVTGLTATVAAGTLANGNGEVNFVISGTPSSSGTATFPISFLGVSNSGCQGGELDVTVSPPELVLSSLDASSMNILNPNGINLNPSTTLAGSDNYQVSIPFVVATPGAHPAISVTSTGITGLTADYEAGTITSDGNLVLDITGTPSGDGNANISVTLGGQIANFNLVSATPPSITAIRCSSNKPKFFGVDLADGLSVVNDGNTYIRVRYTGGNEKAFNSESISSTGVTGLTATVASSTLANGNGEVNFVISGTPTASGTATFPISFLGVSNSGCQGGVLAVPVLAAPVVINNLNCGSSSILNPNLVDLNDASTLITSNNYQVRIPYTITSAGDYSDISISSTGVTGLTAVVTGGTISSNGNLDLTITGSPSGTGTASFALTLGGQSCNFTLAVTAAPVPTITNIRCSGNRPAFFGNALEDGNAVLNDGNTYIRVRYSGGNGIAFSTENINSTGVTGLTATVAAGTLDNGNGEVNFIISGTPSNSGTATFPISFLGVTNSSCDGGVLDVSVISTAPSITNIRCGSSHKPKFNGANLIEGQIVVNDGSTNIRVKYEGGNGENFSSESISSTGVTGLTATVAAGTLASGNGQVNFIISGTPSSSGTATFPISFLGITNTGCDGGILNVNVSEPAAAITSIRCSGNKPTYVGGTITEGDNILASTNNHIRVKYAGGNGGTFTSESISSTGVTGLTATVASGTLANGNGEVEFVISGTPGSSGNATFPISLLGVSNSGCDGGVLSIPILGATPNPLPSNVTLTAGQKAYIVSIYDTDYLPYTAPSTVAATGTSNPGNPSGEPTVNIQGKLTTTGVKIKIPYTVTGASNITLPAFTQTKTVISDHVQGSSVNSTQGGGNSVNVRLSYSSQNLAPGSGHFTATIKSVGSTLKAVKLDINKGIGTDLGIILAQFTIATNSSGGTGNIQLKDIPGIPDRRFGENSNQGGSPGEFHNNIYIPVHGPDGSVWLNNNLGAHYSDITHGSFNPAQTAGSGNDYRAYGSLYQWGRQSDGHELIDFDGATTGTPVNGSVSGPISTSTPNHNDFVKSTINNDWLTSLQNNLWNGVNAPNNPCPEGFRIPTHDEMNELMVSMGYHNSGFSSTSAVVFPLPGFRGGVTATVPQAELKNTGILGYYRTSTTGGNLTKYSIVDNVSQGMYNANRWTGYSVRCILD